MIDLGDPFVLERLLGRRLLCGLAPGDRDAFAGARVLITGAGGSVGGELARQIAACAPSRLTLFEQSEYNLFRIEGQLGDRFPGVAIEPWLGDITRSRSIRAACRSTEPDVVFHAAAYKHVTMTERATCPAVEVNVLGTRHAAQAAREVGARFLLISSDKAAQPRSVMGATKRLAELVTIGLAGTDFRPAVVRFGNVLGSSGSLVEILLDRIQRRLPIRLTHPDATRYFMTAAEAAGLVIKADLLARPGETYWLDMGAPVRIVDLVQRVLALAAEAGWGPVPVEIVGLRPGEKLQEELTTQGLELQRTARRGVWMARQQEVDAGLVRRVLRALRHDVATGDGLSALLNLKAAVPDFVPSDHAWDAATAATTGLTGQARTYPGRLAVA